MKRKTIPATRSMRTSISRGINIRNRFISRYALFMSLSFIPVGIQVHDKWPFQNWTSGINKFG